MSGRTLRPRNREAAAAQRAVPDEEEVVPKSKRTRVEAVAKRRLTAAETASIRTEFDADVVFFRNEVRLNGIVHVEYMLEKLNDPAFRAAQLGIEPEYIKPSVNFLRYKRGKESDPATVAELDTQIAGLVLSRKAYNGRLANVKSKLIQLKVGDLYHLLDQLDKMPAGQYVHKTGRVNPRSFSAYSDELVLRNHAAYDKVYTLLGVMEELDMSIISLTVSSSTSEDHAWNMISRLVYDKWLAAGRIEDANLIYEVIQSENKKIGVADVYKAEYGRVAGALAAVDQSSTSEKAKTAHEKNRGAYFKMLGDHRDVNPWPDTREMMDSKISEKNKADMSKAFYDSDARIVLIKRFQDDFPNIDPSVWSEAYGEKQPLESDIADTFAVPTSNLPVNFRAAEDVLNTLHRAFVHVIEDVDVIAGDFKTLDDYKGRDLLVYRSVGITATPTWYRFYKQFYIGLETSSCDDLRIRALSWFVHKLVEESNQTALGGYFETFPGQRDIYGEPNLTNMLVDMIVVYARENNLVYDDMDSKRYMLSEPQNIIHVMGTVKTTINGFFTRESDLGSDVAAFIHVMFTQPSQMRALFKEYGPTGFGTALRNVAENAPLTLAGQRWKVRMDEMMCTNAKFEEENLLFLRQTYEAFQTMCGSQNYFGMSGQDGFIDEITQRVLSAFTPLRPVYIAVKKSFNRIEKMYKEVEDEPKTPRETLLDAHLEFARFVVSVPEPELSTVRTNAFGEKFTELDAKARTATAEYETYIKEINAMDWKTHNETMPTTAPAYTNANGKPRMTGW